LDPNCQVPGSVLRSAIEIPEELFFTLKNARYPDPDQHVFYYPGFVNNDHFLESMSNEVTVNGCFVSQLSLINSLKSDVDF